jgi:hypothetical protein
MFTSLFTPGVNTIYGLKGWRGEQRIFNPKGEIKNWAIALI